MKTHTVIASLLFSGALAYALFWFANKAVYLHYAQDAAFDHWLLQYFIPVGLADIAFPTALIIAAYRVPHRRTLLLGTGCVFLIFAILFQEITLAEAFFQAGFQATYFPTN
jgi:hypothetical protein